MELSTIATIIVLAVLTLIIFAFAWVVFRQIHATEKAMVEQGKRDEEIAKDKDQQSKKSYKIAGIITNVFSYLIIGVALSFMIFSLIIKSNGSLFSVNGKSLMVVESGSMSSVYDSSFQTYLTDDMISQEFDTGDLLTLTSAPTEDELIPDATKTETDGSIISPYRYHILAYYSESGKNSGRIIIHRLVAINKVKDGTTNEEYIGLTFWGDANGGPDTEVVKPSQLRAQYDGVSKAKRVGYFFLFFESTFGMYAVFSSIVMVTLSSVYVGMIEKEYDKRWSELDHHRLVLYSDIHDIHVKVQAGWANERYELRQKFGELKERAAENHEEVKNKVEEHHEEVKAKVEQHHEEVKAHLEEKKASEMSAKPAAVEPAPVKPVEQPAPVVEAKPEPKVEEPKPEPKPVDKPVETPKPEEPKPMPKKVFGKHGVYVKIVKSEDDPVDQPSGVAIKK
jgi:outer membrane biosynthesis protein TonB